MPKISVIVPVYGVEKYLNRCVDSILNQTFTDFELILVDDGSPDNCGKICDDYTEKDSRVVVIHKENGGAATARNCGLNWVFANSNTEYVSFVDSDDYLKEDYLMVLYDLCILNDAPIAVCAYNRVCDENQEIVQDVITTETLSPEDAFCHVIYSGCPWCKIYKKELFTDIRYPDGWRISEDVATTYKVLFLCDKVVITNKVLYFYRQLEGSLTHSKWGGDKMVRLIVGQEQLEFFKYNYKRAYWHSLEDFINILSLLINWQEKDEPSDKKTTKF